MIRAFGCNHSHTITVVRPTQHRFVAAQIRAMLPRHRQMSFDADFRKKNPRARVAARIDPGRERVLRVETGDRPPRCPSRPDLRWRHRTWKAWKGYPLIFANL